MGLLDVEMPTPTHGRLVGSIEEFYNCAKYLAHFAVKRKKGYFHHFVVITWNNAKAKMLEYFYAFSTCLKGPLEVKKSDIKENEIQTNIKDGTLYVVEDPNYPKTDGEKENAYNRFLQRCGEKAYGVAYNNCEHLVAYILTGMPYSEQIREAGRWVMCKVDIADIIIHGSWNLLKLSSCLIASVPAECFMKAAVNNVKTAIAKSTLKSTIDVSIPTARATKTLCKRAGKKVLNKQCIKVADNTCKEALKKSAKTTFVTTGIIEGAFAAYEIYCLKKEKEENHINEYDYRRAITNSVAGASGATFGSVGGGVLGQAVIPLPWVGFAIGSMIGNAFGRVVASVSAGQIYDEFTSN